MHDAHAEIIIVGAGIVGTALARALARRGLTEVLVLDRGPLEALAGSTGHAPGLIGLFDPSPTVQELATRTARALGELTWDRGDAFRRTGSVEVARSPAYVAALLAKVEAATESGLGADVLNDAQARALLPDLDFQGVELSVLFPDDGAADAQLAVRAMRKQAQDAGVEFRGDAGVQSLQVDGDSARGVVLADGRTLRARQVICCAGLWGGPLAQSAGVHAPIVPVVHPYAITDPVRPKRGDTLPDVPCVRDPERLIYLREHDGAYGIGSYRHEPRPVEPRKLPSATLRLETDLEPSLETELMPAHSRGPWKRSFGGVFSMTPDGLPIVGRTEIEGLLLAEAVWVTHALGVADAVAALVADAEPDLNLDDLDPARFAYVDPQEAWRQAAAGYATIYPPPASLR